MLKFIRKLFRRISSPLQETLFLLGIWNPTLPLHGFAATRFSEANRRYWGSASSAKREAAILVEGHLSEYGPNYLFRTGLAAKAVQEALGGGDIVVVTNGFSYQWRSAINAYASFGISHWAFLGRKFTLIGPFLAVFACVMALWRFISVRTPKQLLDIYLGGIKIGDLIYDEALRFTKQPTIRSINWAVLIVMARSWFYYYQYQLFFSLSKRRYLYYIATHTAYPEYGLLVRVALQRGITVIETTDIQMSTYKGAGLQNVPTYHTGINAAIRVDLANPSKSAEEREALGRIGLRRRLGSEIEQYDAQKAYSGKLYKRDELREELKIPAEHRIGFILAHIFRDSPHLSSFMIHSDYYQWLKSTIEYCSESVGISWVVKPHPSAEVYGEEGMVETMVVASRASNIHTCPSDLNTSSLEACADVLLTVHGTAGLEYACHGIPIILAGTPFYAGFGFTLEPKTEETYAVAVRRAASLNRLSGHDISTALQVFEVWERQFDWSNRIVTSQVVDHVWGNGVSRDLVRAYELITENLVANNPKELKLWHYAKEMAGC